jgi:hypothetical protein
LMIRNSASVLPIPSSEITVTCGRNACNKLALLFVLIA